MIIGSASGCTSSNSARSKSARNASSSFSVMRRTSYHFSAQQMTTFSLRDERDASAMKSASSLRISTALW
jgi:hypothetical protein